MPDTYDDPVPGDGLLGAAFAGTGAVAGTSLASIVLPDAFGAVHAVLSTVLFVVGTGALLWAYALGVARSRTVKVTLGGLFFLAGGVAPGVVRLRFRLALAVEIAAVVLAAAVHPFTVAAFGVLAPMFGLGLMSVYGGRHGVYAGRDATSPGSGPA